MDFDSAFNKICQQKPVTKREIVSLLKASGREQEKLFELASSTRNELFGKKIFIRLCIEISNVCRNSCLFCGMRKQNQELKRYKLPVETIKDVLKSCKNSGMELIQFSSGEEQTYSTEELARVISEAKKYCNNITLALGLKGFSQYKQMFQVGATNYVLKFETSNPNKFKVLKPDVSLAERRSHLEKLKKIGYRIGSGNIVGLPDQTLDDIANDLLLMGELGLYIAESSVFCPNRGSAYAEQREGDKDLTLNCIAISRILLRDTPLILASSSLHERLEEAFAAGANLISTHATPKEVFNDYSVYGGAGRIKVEESTIAGFVRSMNTKGA